ncbi:MAG: ATP-binding protein [Microbacterium sp.]|uniref:ATP-binding protein n=1 Tax=Microbacterium sp. TaxID=51671 RepID=UPI0039E573D4
MQPASRPDRLSTPAAPPWAAPWWVWPIAAAVIFLAAGLGLRFSPVGSAVAAWWPGAGLSVLFVLLAGPRRRWTAVALVLVVTAVANVTWGREPLVSLLFGVANAAETATISLLLQRPHMAFQLETTRNAVRFVLAVVVGALVIGTLAGAAVAAVDGTVFLDSALHAATSHAAAVLLIAPFGVLPPPAPEKAHWPEVIGQSLLMAVTIVLVFSPITNLPLSFLPFAFMAWAAFRFPMPMALAQTLATAVAVLVFTLAGGGPFAVPELTSFELVLVVEAYMIVLAVFAILLGTARYEVRQATRTALTVSQVITGGFVDSRVGLLIGEDLETTPRVLWANRAAVDAVGAELSDDGTWAGPLARSARASFIEQVETMYEDPVTGSTFSLVANRVAGDQTRFAVQLVDVAAAIRMAQARHDAEIEREVARRIRVDLERQRDDFIATTSHELRTPITSIRGYAELLADTPSLGPLERSWVEIIDRNTARLTDLAADLLALGRASADPTPRSAESVALRALVADVVAMHQPMAAGKQITVEVEIAEATRVRCAPDDASRALGNLLSNAVKFTPPGGRIRITEAETDGRPSVCVRDTGPGMSPETRAHAFERFYRGADAERASTPGTGLGLAIAAELAARNGGEIRLGDAPDRGVEATLVFRDPTTE